MLPLSDLNTQDVRNYKGEVQKSRSARNLWQNDQKSPRADVQQKKVRKKSTFKFENAQDDIIQIQLASDESYEIDINEEIEIDKNAILRGTQKEISPDKRKTFRAQNQLFYKTIQQYIDEELIDEEKDDIQDYTPTPLVRQNQKLCSDEILFQKNLQIPDILDEFVKLYETDPHNDNYNLQLVLSILFYKWDQLNYKTIQQLKVIVIEISPTEVHLRQDYFVLALKIFTESSPLYKKE